VFEQANGGTLLIDEIGDLDLSLQPKLLRVLDRKELRRVGGNRTLSVDVRIIAATRRDLDAEVQAGRFRDDLFHRLAVARIELPPLRRRRGDVAHLVAGIASQLGGDASVFTPELLARWDAYAWPGNVRELRNAVARRLELGDLADWDAEEALPPSRPVSEGERGIVADGIERILALGLPITEARKLMVTEFEHRYLERILEAHGGVVTRAAAASGIARRHFHRLLHRSG
jgi:DNA-binding NtrC family response regulator